MTVMNYDSAEPPKKYRPTGSGGGARKKETNKEWPWVLRVMAEAIQSRPKGGINGWTENVRMMPRSRFGPLMDQLCPGWREYRLWQLAPATVATPLEVLLANRVRKMYYIGHSSGRVGVVPLGEVPNPKEHWMYRFPTGHPLQLLHHAYTNERLSAPIDWKKYL